MSVATHFAHVPWSARGRCAAGPVVRERLIGGEDESTGYRSSVRRVIRARTAPCEKRTREGGSRARLSPRQLHIRRSGAERKVTSREERRDRSGTARGASPVSWRCSDEERGGGKRRVVALAGVCVRACVRGYIEGRTGTRARILRAGREESARVRLT